MKNLKRVVAALAVLSICGCPNMFGWNKASAEDHAHKWAAEVGLDVSKVVCGSSDTDDDGNVSCTFHVGDDIRTFECAGWTLLIPHDGCREPKIKVPRMKGGK